jgi:methylase of polypeptide subunit release factors
MGLITIRSLGEVYVPGILEEAATDAGGVRVFEGTDLQKASRLFDHVARGGIAVLLGPWPALAAALEYVEKRKSELATGEPPRKGTRRRGKNRRAWEKERERALQRLTACANGNRIVGGDPGVTVPCLLEFLGEPAGSSGGRPFLVPVRTVRQLRERFDSPQRVEPLGADLVVPDPVLAPVSPETVDLMKEALEAVSASLPRPAAVLDMGCGSGSLTLLAALVLGERAERVTATDTLPEALAATRVNRDRLMKEERIAPGVVEVTEGGDLFEPVGGRTFDLILFNAPWVTAPARSRSEIATHDGGQNVVGRFLEGAAGYLAPSGSLLLEYSDHSGSGAVENLMALTARTGWTVEGEWKKRIQARRKSPKWENIFVFHLVRAR